MSTTPKDGQIINPRFDVRPMLVIGVGGTGCLAVKCIKKRILEVARGQMPSFIRFLVFDTTTQDPTRDPLDDSEFVNIGRVNNFNHIVDHIDRYPHLEKWFPVHYLRPMQLGLGAMGVRHIGRLCYFQHRETPQVLGRLRDRIDRLFNPDLASQVGSIGHLPDVHLDQSSGLDIHIIGSGAGGTGSGLFLDLAYDIRNLTDEKQVDSNIAGHLMLPDAFEGIIPASLMPQAENNSISLITEINHFSEEANWCVDYQGGRVEMRKRTPFDMMFLLGKTGQGGFTRTRNDLAAIIGHTVGSLALTRVGKRLKEDIVNVIPPLLNTPDEIHHKPRLFGSYGLSVGVLTREELEEAAATFLRQAVIRAVRERSPAGKKDIPAIVNAFLLQHGLGSADYPALIRLVPEVNALPASFANAKAAEEQLKLLRAREEAVLKERRANWNKELGGKFDVFKPELLLDKLTRLFRYSGATLPQLDRMHEIQDFINSLIEALGQLVSWCDERWNDAEDTKLEASKKQSAAMSDQASGWESALSAGATQEARARVNQEFLRDLSKMARDQRTELRSTFEPILNSLSSALVAAQAAADGKSIELDEQPSPALRMFSGEEIADCLRDFLTGAAQQLREALLDGILRNVESNPASGAKPGNFQNVVDQCMNRVVDETLKSAFRSFEIDGGIDMNLLADEVEKARPGGLANRTLLLYHGAEPALRCISQQPRGTLVAQGRVGSDPDGPIFKHLQKLDATIQAESDNPREALLMRFVFGIPLWAVQGLEGWLQSALNVQVANNMPNNYLDPAWAAVINPVNPLSEKDREDHRLFTYGCALELIQRVKGRIDLYYFVPEHEPRISNEGRSLFFADFVNWLDASATHRKETEQYFEKHWAARAEIHAKEEIYGENHPRPRPQQERLRLFKEHRASLFELQKEILLKCRHNSSKSREAARQDIALVRKEIEVMGYLIAELEIEDGGEG